MTQGLGIDCVHCSRNGDEKGEWSWRGLYVGAHILMNRQQLFKKYTTSWQGLPALLCIAVKRSPQCLCNKEQNQWSNNGLYGETVVCLWKCDVVGTVHNYMCTSAAQQSPCEVLGLMSPINRRGKFWNKLNKAWGRSWTGIPGAVPSHWVVWVIILNIT